jgi:hypothetical protein
MKEEAMQRAKEIECATLPDKTIYVYHAQYGLGRGTFDTLDSLMENGWFPGKAFADSMEKSGYPEYQKK